LDEGTSSGHTNGIGDAFDGFLLPAVANENYGLITSYVENVDYYAD